MNYSLQDESTEKLLELVQTEGLRPMLKQEYERGVADGRKAQIRTLAPELRDFIAELQQTSRANQREQRDRDMEAARNARRDAEERANETSSLRYSIEFLKGRIDERDDQRRELDRLEAVLVAIEERVSAETP